MSKTSAPVLFLLGLLAVAVVGGATAGIVVLLDLSDDSGDDGLDLAPGGAAATDLQDDQVAITGVAVGVTVEGATIELLEAPLVVTAQAGDGGGATLADVEVDGQVTDIVWDAGRPFNLLGAGLGIRPRTLNLFAAPTAVTVGFPDGEVHELAPGSYGLETPVAVGRGGLAVPVGSIAFEATVESTIVFRGGATTSLLPRELEFEAAGKVLLQGQLQIRTPDGVTREAVAVELPDGAFRVRATPRPDGSGYDIDALLQGPVTVT